MIETFVYTYFTMETDDVGLFYNKVTNFQKELT